MSREHENEMRRASGSGSLALPKMYFSHKRPLSERFHPHADVEVGDHETAIPFLVILGGAVVLTLTLASGSFLASVTGLVSALTYLSITAILVGAFFLYSGAYKTKANEAHVRAVIDRAADGIITADEQGRIETLNPAAERIFGYRDAELLGCNIMVLLSSVYADEEDGDLWDSLRMNAFEATGRAQEVIGLRRRGEKFFMDLSISEAVIGERSVFVAIIRDVTERKKAQIAVKGAQERLETRVALRTTELKESNGHLREEIRERKRTEAEREALVQELRGALADIKTLSGLIPICASCKNVRDDKGYWNQIEVYVRDHSEAEFSHGICPDCAKELYPDYKYTEEEA